MKNTRNAILQLLVILSWMACAAPDKVVPPDIILLQADDLGFSDLGTNGNSTIKTPRLDQLAENSLRFKHFYVTPVCATTRASLLTGRHHLRTGVSHVHGGKDFLHLEERTLAQALKANGYVTGMWGKWHSGKTPGYYPWERGFDQAYMADLYRHENSTGSLNGQRVQHHDWADAVIVNYALEFIKKPRDQPYFAYLSFLTCHAPLHAPGEFVHPYLQQGLSTNLATLYGMISHMDFHMGRLLDSLQRWDKQNNTLILFMSDNGPAVLNDQLTRKDRSQRYIHNLRGHKGNIWENGVRSPLFVCYPGRIRPGESPQLTDVTDIFPTLLALSGSEQNNGSALPLDGVNLLPLWLGNTDSIEREIYFYADRGWPPSLRPWTPAGVFNEYLPIQASNRDTLLAFTKQHLAWRSPRFKYLWQPSPIQGQVMNDSGSMLVQIPPDYTESENVIFKYPEVTPYAHGKLEKWFQSIRREPHAFAAPVFLVDRDADNPVLPYAAVQVDSGLHVGFNYLEIPATPGKWISKYAIRVKQAGSYRFTWTGKDTHLLQEATLMSKAARASASIDHESVHWPVIALDTGNHILEFTFQTQDEIHHVVRLEKGNLSVQP